VLELPLDFVASIKELYPTEADALLETLDSNPPTSIRLNVNKSCKVNISSDVIPWNPNGRYLDQRPSFTLDPFFQAGAYYVQEASSQILAFVIEQLSISNEIKIALDLCAAPGGKTTLLVDALPQSVIIVANEVIKSRAQILKENIIKWGCCNVIITSNDPHQFSKSYLKFDLILVDAPCSGEGMFRKDLNAINEWSTESVIHCAGRQKRILDDILPCLNEGGTIIYSTCTYNSKENIEQVNWMCKNCDLESVELEIPQDYGVLPIYLEQAVGYQCMPHRLKGEGFFFSVIKKRSEGLTYKSYGDKKIKLIPLSKTEVGCVEDFIKSSVLSEVLIHPNGNAYYIPHAMRSILAEVMQMLSLAYAGVLIGSLKNKVFIPDHSLAMSRLVNQCVPRFNLNKEEAINYLRRQLNEIKSEGKGWQLACFDDLPLGWFKQLGNRINNYFPTELRIRM
jgi:16S rRNA C967 or C1407 C5-methylase (RsmB/RsmF family)/NOL1/NOP2/fmu family ribosome biogenesis protein